MDARFTAAHRGGSGPPLVCVHGFSDTWRSWELVLPMLESHHDVLAPTLPGHAGGPPLRPPLEEFSLVEGVEAAMDAAGFEAAHVVGNSLGGYLALQLAARGRALSVVALAPGGGWTVSDAGARDALERHRVTQELVRRAAPHADEIAATPAGRRQATQTLTVNYEQLPAELVAHLIRGAAAVPAAGAILDWIAADGYRPDPERVSCPLRIVWGTEDRVLPWPQAAARYREQLFPHAEWIELPGVGHAPQLDVPLQTAELILGLTRAA